MGFINRLTIVIVVAVVSGGLSAWWYAATPTTDQREVEAGVRTRFSAELAPAMIELRWAVESPKGVTDTDLVRWLNASQIGTLVERQEAANLFMGLAIDWPWPVVREHAETLVHIAGTLLANSDGDESIAAAGLAIACEIDMARSTTPGVPSTQTRQALKDIADGINRTATTVMWKTLYAEAYPAYEKK